MHSADKKKMGEFLFLSHCITNTKYSVVLDKGRRFNSLSYGYKIYKSQIILPQLVQIYALDVNISAPTTEWGFRHRIFRKYVHQSVNDPKFLSVLIMMYILSLRI